jgi:hypothetical protein
VVQVGSLSFRTAAEVAAALDVVEGDLGRDLDRSFAVTVEAEAAAAAFGDEELAMRARLLKADISERKGYPARVVDALRTVNRWAADHDCRPLLARSHVLLARTYRNLGDMSAYLDHAVSAVEAAGPDAPAHIPGGDVRVGQSLGHQAGDGQLGRRQGGPAGRRAPGDPVPAGPRAPRRSPAPSRPAGQGSACSARGCSATAPAGQRFPDGHR